MSGRAHEPVEKAERETCAPQVAEQLARLREVGVLLRQRRSADVVAVCGAVLERFRDAGSEERRALEATLPEATGFAPATIRAGLELALADWTAAALEAVVTRELGPDPDAAAPGAGVRVAGFDTVATLLAGAIPMPALLSLLAPLVLRSAVLARPSQHDAVTAPLVARALAALDPGLGACVEVAGFPRDDEAATAAFAAADCVVATGSDETVRALAARVAPPRRFVGYGHRVSLAVLGPEALREPALDEATRALALDVALWDQLGCLSPVSVHVVAAGARGSAADAVAAALAAALAEVGARLPRGEVPLEAEAAIAHARNEAELRGAAGRAVSLYAGADFTVVKEADPRPRTTPLHRFVRVHPAPGPEALLDALAPLGPHLAAVALAGFGPDQAEVAAAMARLGASRVCVPGRMQAPPLGWHHDGQPLLLPLARFCDLDLA